MESKSIAQIFDNFIMDLIQNYNPGDDCVTEITISPFLFRLLEDQVLHRSPYDYRSYKAIPPTKCTLHTQTGKITIKKDVKPLIEEKQRRVDLLLKEIENLKNEQ